MDVTHCARCFQGKEKEQADRRREIAQRLEKERLAAKKAGKGLDVSSFRGVSAAPQLSRGPPVATAASPTGPSTESHWAPSPTGGMYDSRHHASPGGPTGAAGGGQQFRGMQLGASRPLGDEEGLLQNLVQVDGMKAGGYADVQTQGKSGQILPEALHTDRRREGVLLEFRRILIVCSTSSRDFDSLNCWSLLKNCAAVSQLQIIPWRIPSVSLSRRK